ncbi:hypothetical protein BHE74_00023741 [Ensete ventricosum]|nr:hypothetical protein BHE74_00023741 [Ensete ventricosum]
MATASPFAGAAGHLQRGGRLQPGPSCKGAVGCGQAPCKGRPLAVAVAPRARTAAASPQGAAASSQAARACCPRSDHKRQPPATRPQVAAAHCKAARGSPAARAAACKGGRWQERPPAGAAPAQGGAARPRGVARG